MPASRTLVRFTCCFLSYLLMVTFVAPPTWRAAASPVGAPSGAGKAARGVEPKKSHANAPSRDGELLVRFREDVTEQGREGLAASKGARRRGRLRGDSRLERLELRAGQNPAAVAEELRGEPSVELVEPNFVIARAQVVPNDPRFAEQWALRNTGQAGGVPGSDIGVSNAWGTDTGLQSAVVAVVDSGVDFTHPDLLNNRWANAREKENGKDDDHNGYVNDLNGWDWVADSGAIRDENGHGTAVAGIIAAQGNNGAGVSGVMWRASLMSLRVLNSGGTGDVADAVEAIDYAAEAGAQVVNCSWGTDAESLILRDAIERAGRRGVVVVASAGNGTRDLDTQPYYPASFDLPNVISVASSDQFDNLAQFSNWGAARVTVAAPGTDILTTKMGGDYRLVSGTSFSTPLVAGVVGLVKTQRPWLPAANARQAVLDGARRVVTLAGKVTANGVVSAPGALSRLQGQYDAPGTGGGGNGNGNEGAGNGNGNGNGGSAQPPRDPGRGRGNYTGSAPPATPAATAGGPNLNALRDAPSYVPQEPPPPGISSNAPPACDDCYEAAGSDPQFSTSRGLPGNETGQPAVDLGSKNFNWALPVVSLPGRAGLDLSLTLSYNSLVWVKQGNAMQYNADGGYPSPGFQLGIPQLQKPFTDGSGQSAYMMVTPSGGRITLRYAAVNTYEDRDGSYAQMKLVTGGWAQVTTTEGTQYTFEPKANGEKRCVEIKDRNGNVITFGYDGAGRVSTATDTLGRVVGFVYNGNGQLYQLTQARGGSGHTDLLAQFAYADLYMSPYFTDANGNQLATLGPNTDSISVLTQVWLPDGETYNFDYTLYGQVYKITRRAADGHDLSYVWYNLSSSPDTPHIAQQDCPRFTERRDWAEYGVMQQSQAVSTFYGTNAAGTVTQVTYPDGTIYKEFFADGSGGVKAGLTTGSEVWSGSQLKKWTTMTWGYATGGVPQLTQTVIEDAEGNRRRTDIEYLQGYGLPTHVREYGKINGQDVMLRLTAFNYNLDSAYVNRRVIGLPGERIVYDGVTGYILSKEWYMYDWGAPYFSAQAPSTQYSDPQTIVGRGNLTAVYRFSCQGNSTTCDSGGEVWAARTGYDMAGSPVWVQDALGHQANFSYTDSFSDTSKNGLNTRAYQTSTTDAENYTSTAKYDYTTGAPTETRRPSSGTNSQNNVTYETHSFIYDWSARLVKDETLNNGFYTRWEYPADGRAVKTFQNIRGDLAENYSVEVYDGAGRVRRTASYMPGSTTLYSGRQVYYDGMGRVVQWTNPTEMDGNW
ncbi:MAG: S8 family serine peptidase, partial [Pyrinomonadaceae bacterium]